MSSRRVKALLLACTGIGALCVTSIDANAGGFAIREQSAYGQGSSFAGIAAGGALSSMFWNPAIITQFTGKTIESDIAGIFPTASHSYTTSSLSPVPGFAGTVGNSGKDALVPSMYASWQLNDRFWLGLSVNAPFGLAVTFPKAWAGAGYGQDSKLESYNFAPTVAYKINDWISVAAGVQLQYMKVSYDALVTPLPLRYVTISGNGWSYGFTLGTTITPTPTTTIGIGYRSALNQKIDGSMDLTGPAVPATSTGPVNLTLNLPDMLTVGLRQRIGDKFTLLAGFEWAHWSRIGTPGLFTGSGAPATIGGGAVRFPFQYSDGYFYSLGGEYAFNPNLMLRAGIGFEKSPITDNVRTPRLPDNDRVWYSVGASYKPAMWKGVTLDLGYSFIDVKDTPINITAASGNPWFSALGNYVGSVDSHIHIVSVALRYQWDNAAPVKTKLVTK